MKRATCKLSLQATTQHLCRYGNLSKLTMHSLFTPAQKSVQLTGPRSRRAQEKTTDGQKEKKTADKKKKKKKDKNRQTVEKDHRWIE